MEEISFEYGNLKFRPIRNFTKIEKERCIKGDLLNYYEWIDINGYSHCDFYKQSKKVNGENIDIFSIENGLLKGLLVVPCTNYLAVIKNVDNYFFIESCKKVSELYEELYSSKISLFRLNPIAQIYWDNKKGYELEIFVNFEKKSIAFKVNTLEFKTIEFEDFYGLYNWLKDKNIDYFREKYNDYFITEEVVNKILLDEVNLSELEINTQETYILFLYKHILYYIYKNKNIVALKLNDYKDEFVTVGEKSNEDVLLEIKKDILNEVNKDINYCLFDNVDYD